MEDSEHYAAHNELLKLAEEYEQLNDIKEWIVLFNFVLIIPTIIIW